MSQPYFRNRDCRCQRCRSKGLMGAAILITLGILFLLENYHLVDFDQTWPVLLIVIGIFVFAGRNASMEGHVQPYLVVGNTPPSAVPPPPQSNPEVKQ